MRSAPAPSKVSGIFSEIAQRYDLANRILSLGFDQRWRRKLVQSANLQPGERVLDLCTGTGDLPVAFAKKYRAIEITGLDISSEMLVMARAKLIEHGLEQKIDLIEGDALHLPFPSERFDAVSIAFGLRNLTQIEAGLAEMRLVLRPGGRLLILEFSLPTAFLWSSLYRFYLKRILPPVGGRITGSRAAYQYLYDSICSFPAPAEILAEMRRAGFQKSADQSLMGGIAVLYRGEKP